MPEHPTSGGRDQNSSTSDDPSTTNLVRLRGRLSGEPIERELPSGDLLLTFSLTVPRPPGERVRVDSLECVATRPRVRRILARAAPGELLEVEGRLQRRFWRSPTGPASRYAVAVEVVRRCKAAPSAPATASNPSGAVSSRRRRPTGA